MAWRFGSPCRSGRGGSINGGVPVGYRTAINLGQRLAPSRVEHHDLLAVRGTDPIPSDQKAIVTITDERIQHGLNPNHL